MSFNLSEEVDERRHVKALLVEPSPGHLPSPYQAIRAWYRGGDWT